MSLLARLRSPLAVYLAASTLARVFSIVLIPLYTRKLSPEEYGDYALAQTLVNILPLLFTAGLVAAIPRFLYDGEKEAARARTAVLASWLVVLSVAGGLVLVPIVYFFGREGDGLFGRWQLGCIAIASVGVAISAFPHVYLRGTERPLTAAAFQIGQFLALALSGIFFVVVLGRGLRGSVEGLAVGYGLWGLVSTAFILTSVRGALDRKILWEGLRFAIGFLPHLMAGWLQSVTDRWTLKGVGLDRDLGKYSLASTLASPTQMVVAAFADADNPKQGEAFRKDGIPGLLRILRRTRIAYLAATLAPALLILLAVPILSLVVGKNFVSALGLLPFLFIAPVLDGLYYPSANLVYYTERTRFVPIATVSGASANVILNLVLASRYGVAGAIGARIAAAALRLAIMMIGARLAVREKSH